MIAVHPDDETLGSGGTLLKHKEQGDIVSWLIVTCISEENGFSLEFAANREIEIQKVADMYRFDNIVKLNLLATRLDEIPFSKLVDLFSEKIRELKPDTIILPNRSDVHSDHRYSFDAAYSCTKSFRYPFITKILMCETLSETEFAPALSANAFIPNVFVDISDFMDKKLEIMSIFSSEVMVNNLPRSYSAINALATYRGSRIGVNYAEAFMLLYEKC
jgi:LmbE family N-acetylglucosaminyl deacetylase